MGNLASVLQWNCQNCNTINPTESLNCGKCGNVRKIFPHNYNGAAGSSKFYTDRAVSSNTTESDQQDESYSPPVSAASASRTSHQNQKHSSSNSDNNLPGYVEISNG